MTKCSTDCQQRRQGAATAHYFVVPHDGEDPELVAGHSHALYRKGYHEARGVAVSLTKYHDPSCPNPEGRTPRTCPHRFTPLAWDEARRSDRVFMVCPRCGQNGSHVGLLANSA